MTAETQYFKTASMQRRCSQDHSNHLQNFELQTSLPSSSDDSAEEDILDVKSLGVDDQAIVGVSISRAQTHLASPKTSAAEKQAALLDSIDAKLDGLDERLQDIPAEDRFKLDDVSQDPVEPPLDGRSSPPRLLSPWRAGPKKLQILESAPANKKFFSFHLPSLPRNPFGNALVPPKLSEQSMISKTAAHQPQEDSLTNISPNQTQYSFSSSNRSENSMTSDSTLPKPTLLRRSTSDSKYFLDRQLSITPSLGDDTRWENVNEQINSRVRALKDTWADSNFKMPRIRSLTHLNFGAPWAELPHHDREGNRRDSGEYRSREYLATRHASAPLSGGALAVAREGTMPAARKTNKVSPVTHPEFGKALDDLVGDIIILGGYRGSVLRSAKAPHRQLWVPMKVGLNLRKANLELGFTEEDEIHSEDLIIPSGMLKSIGPVDISKRLFKRLRSSQHAREGRLRVWDYGYDWRLSPHILSQQLLEVLEDLPCNSQSALPNQRGAIVIAHSLGGLITRHAVNQRPDLFSGVVYAGVPQHCVNILGPLRNGDDVMLSSRVLTAQVNFSIRTTFALLPLDGKCFMDADTKEPIPVDFFDVQHWEDYSFSPCIARPLPPLISLPPQGFINRAMATAVNAFPITRRNSLKALNANNDATRSDASSNDISAPMNQQFQSMGAPPQMGNKPNPQELGQNEETNVSTAVTIPKDAALTYLRRTLAETKAFKQQLAYRPSNSRLYPPTAVLFGKSLPTVTGCKVRGREGIKHADAYDNLTFASGDGVVLARAAMIPEGYRVARGGVVSSERGHISLLGDLEAVGRCLNAVLAEQKRRRDWSGSGSGSGGGGGR